MNGTGDVQLLAAGHLFWEQPYGAGGGGAQGSVFFFVLGSNQTWDEASKNMQTCG